VTSLRGHVSDASGARGRSRAHPGGQAGPRLPRLYQRFRALIHEGAKFLVVGGIGFAVTEAGFNLLHFDLRLGLFTSNAVATIAAMAVTFTGNRYWTFRDREGHGTARETISFVVLNTIGLLIQYACVWIAQDAFGVTGKIPTNIAYLFGIALGTLFRFWSYRRWVWLAPGAPGAIGPARRTRGRHARSG